MQSKRNELINRVKRIQSRVDLQLKSIDFKFDQYDLLPNIKKYINQSIKLNPASKKARGIEFLSQEERGLCVGLSDYYLYSKGNNRGKEFFNRLAVIAQAKWETEDSLERLEPAIEMEFIKLTNYIRWLHNKMYISTYHHSELGKKVEVIRHDDEAPVIHEFGIASFFTEEEFLNIFNKCLQGLQDPRMVGLRTCKHAMGLYIENTERFCFYDPDFEGGCEVILETPEDLHAWLVYRSLHYDISKLEEAVPPYLELGMDFFRNQNTAEKIYPDPFIFIKECIANDSKYLQRTVNSNQSLLFLNCFTYHPETVFKLLENKEYAKSSINVFIPNFHFTPLIYCCQENYIDLVEALLNSGADPNMGHDPTPLEMAINFGRLEVTKLLIQAGADLNKTIKSSSLLPLFHAVKAGNLEISKVLFNKYRKAGGQVDTPDAYKNTLFLYAVESGNRGLVDFLLEQGANRKDALQVSIRWGYLEVASYLMHKFQMVSEAEDLVALLNYKQPETFHFIQSAILSGSDIFRIRYHFGSSQSLASWALSNTHPKSEQEIACIQSILQKLEENPVSKFVANVTCRINKLKDRLIQEQDKIYLKRDFLRYSEELEKIGQKISGMTEMLKIISRDPGKPVGEIVRVVGKKYPLLLSGFIPHPEKNIIDLIIMLEENEKQAFPSIAHEQPLLLGPANAKHVPKNMPALTGYKSLFHNNNGSNSKAPPIPAFSPFAKFKRQANQLFKELAASEREQQEKLTSIDNTADDATKVDSIKEGTTILLRQLDACVTFIQQLKNCNTNTVQQKNQIKVIKDRINWHCTKINQLFKQTIRAVPELEDFLFRVERDLISTNQQEAVCGPLFNMIKISILQSNDLIKLKDNTKFTQKEMLFNEYCNDIKAAKNLAELKQAINANPKRLQLSLEENFQSFAGLKLYSKLFESEDKTGMLQSTSQKYMLRLRRQFEQIIGIQKKIDTSTHVEQTHFGIVHHT